MTRTKALKLRDVLDYLFKLAKDQYHFAAIRQSYPTIPDSEWEVCLYGNTRHSSFLPELGTLATALDAIISDIIIATGEYDAGTTNPDIRTCIILR